jgi:hypothetical protein
MRLAVQAGIGGRAAGGMIEDLFLDYIPVEPEHVPRRRLSLAKDPVPLFQYRPLTAATARALDWANRRWTGRKLPPVSLLERRRKI